MRFLCTRIKSERAGSWLYPTNSNAVKRSKIILQYLSQLQMAKYKKINTILKYSIISLVPIHLPPI